MAVEYIGLLGVAVMFVLMFLRVPLAISMAIPAFAGILYLRDTRALVQAIESIVWSNSYNYALITIPLFVLMGELLYASNISSDLFTSFKLWFGRLKGGLATATIGTSAMFAAASGSTLANTATVGVIASKEMLGAKYSKSLTAASILGGGTLGILIPPSTLLIFYAIVANASIGRLLLASIIPGIALALLYALTIYLTVLVNPQLAPTQDVPATWRERFASLKSSIWIIAIFALVIGGIFIGWFTPTEAAGIGAFGTMIIAAVRKKLTWKVLSNALSGTVTTTSFIFAILLSASVLNYFFATTRFPMLLANLLTDTGFSALGIFLLVIAVYIVLGIIMDEMAMITITLPIVIPIMQAYGFDLVWFGIIVVLVMQIGFLTPPVGMILYILNGIAPEIGLGQIFKGALFMILPILVLVVLLYVFPEIALFLPDAMR